MKAELLKEQARLHEQREEWVQAIDLYTRAVDELDREDQPDLALYNRLGDLEIRVGNVERAVDHYERAIELYLESELPNNAIAICRKVVRNLPTRHHIFLKMGQIRAKQGFLTDARSNFLEYAERMQRDEDLEEAFRALIEFVELAPEDIEARHALAAQLEAHDRKEEAVEQYIAMHQRLVRKDRPEEAQEIEQQIRALDPAVVIPPPSDPESDEGALAFETTSLAAEFPEAGADAASETGFDEVEVGLGTIEITSLDEDGGDTDPDVVHSADPGDVTLDDAIDFADAAADIDTETSFAAAAADLDPETSSDDVAADLDVETSFADVTPDLDAETSFADVAADLDAETSVADGSVDVDVDSEASFADVAADLDRIDGTDELAEDFGFGDLELGEAGSVSEADLEADDEPKTLDASDPLPLISFDDEPGSSSTEDRADEALGAADFGVRDDDRGGEYLEPAESLPELETDLAGLALAEESGEVEEDGDASLDEALWTGEDTAAPETPLGGAWPDEGERSASPTGDGWPDEGSVPSETAAVVALQAKLEEDPDDGESWLALAEQFRSEQRSDECTMAAEQAVTSFRNRDDVGGAIRALDALIANQPDAIEHRQRLVELAIQRNDPGVLASAYLGLATCLVRSGDTASAAAVYQQVLVSDPENASALEGLEALEAAPSEPAAEVASSEDYVDLGSMVLDEGEEKTTRWRVAAEEPTGDDEADFAKMLSQFKEKVAENLEADDLAAHYDLGTAYKEMGLVDEAISEFQQALRAQADHLPTHELLGQCFMEKEQYEVAVHSMGRALEVGPEVEDELLGIYYQMARAHQELGNKGEALEFYEKVFALDINFQDVTERLRELR